MDVLTLAGLTVRTRDHEESLETLRAIVTLFPDHLWEVCLDEGVLCRAEGWTQNDRIVFNFGECGDVEVLRAFDDGGRSQVYDSLKDALKAEVGKNSSDVS